MSQGKHRDPELVKLYYRIGEVSQIVGVQPHVLRYWETEFRNIRPQKSRKGQRIYSRRDVEKLLRVKDLLRNEGFTIAGARRRLKEQPHSEPTTATAAAPQPSSNQRPTPTQADLQSASSQGDLPFVSDVTAARPSRRVSPAAFELVDDSQPRAATKAVMWSVPPRSSGGGAAASAKSMRRRLVEIRSDIVRMLGELGAEPEAASR